MLRSLRARLLLGYTVLALLSVVLASGAALALFGQRLIRDAQAGMVSEAWRVAERLEDRLALLPVASSDERELAFALRRALGPGSAMIVDGQGLPVAALGRGAEPDEGESRRESIERPLGFGGRRGPGGRGRGFESLQIPLSSRSLLASGRPEVSRFEPPEGPALYFAVAETPATAERLGLDEAYVVVLRPAREVRGLWLTMAPSVALAGSLAVLAAGLAALALARTIARPVQAVTQASARLAAGDHEVRVPVEGAEEFKSLAHSFNAMARDVGEAHRRQRELVVNVGHDLRTPLTTIRGFAEALIDGTARSDTQRAAALKAIAGAATRMDGQVEELLELARLEGQSGGLERGAVSLEELLSALASDVAGLANEREVILNTGIQEDLLAWVDERWLARALLNVLSNGVQHSPRGGVVNIIARAAEESQGAQRSSDTDGSTNIGPVEILIRDEGPGIPVEQRARVFERFYRGDPARRAGGSGLGLAIAREIVEAHGGRIEILGGENEPSTFSVWLPGRDVLHPA